MQCPLTNTRHSPRAALHPMFRDRPKENSSFEMRTMRQPNSSAISGVRSVDPESTITVSCGKGAACPLMACRTAGRGWCSLYVLITMPAFIAGLDPIGINHHFERWLHQRMEEPDLFQIDAVGSKHVP